MISTKDLNEQQKELLSDAKNWWYTGRKQTYEISGPAGSGKTSMVELIISEIGLDSNSVLYMAYVGKAAMMLTLGGNPAKTIHSQLYVPKFKPLLDANKEPIMSSGRPIMYQGFEKKESLDSHVKLLVVDEGSMVNEEFRKDILSFGLPVIVLGDLNQLPPVIGKPAFLIKPDFILTEIMRQNKDNPIVKLSQMAIRGIDIPIGKYGDMCFVIPQDMVNDSLLKAADIIICGKNATRQTINDYYRKSILGIEEERNIMMGEKLICRQNNWNLSIDKGIYLTNGLIGNVGGIDLESYNKKSIKIDFIPEFPTDEIFRNVQIDYNYLFTPMELAAKSRFSYYNKFQFAYAITAHLAQGSQYNKVLIYDEKLGDREYYNKWLYTCITRAIRGLVLSKPTYYRPIKNYEPRRYKDAA